MIDSEHRSLSIARQCQLVSISRSGFYYQPSGESDLNLALMRLIDEQHMRTPFYGARQMVRYLRREGYVVSRKRVRRLMHKMSLCVIYQRPRTTVPALDHEVLSVPAPRPRDRPAEPGVVRGYNVHFHAARLSLPRCHHGLGEPQGAGLATVEYNRFGVLHRSTEGGACEV